MKNLITQFINLFRKSQPIVSGSYQEIQGDLLNMFADGKFDAIGHVTNCFASMSGGIALQIARRWPQVADADFKYYVRMGGDTTMLGTIDPIAIGNGNIVNMYGQFQPGRQDPYNYEALRQCLHNLNNMSRLIKRTNIGFNQLGCGIGGADWSVVKQIIIEEMVDCQVTVVIWK